MAARGLGAGRGCSARCGKRRGGGIAEVRRTAEQVRAAGALGLCVLGGR